MQTKLHKVVMRRVYYSYAVGFLTESLLWQGFLLGACIALFGRLTHVAAIEHNLLNASLQNAPSYILNSFTNALAKGEVMTVLVVLFMIGLSLSFMYRALPMMLAAVQSTRVRTV